MLSHRRFFSACAAQGGPRDPPWEAVLGLPAWLRGLLPRRAARTSSCTLRAGAGAVEFLWRLYFDHDRPPTAAHPEPFTDFCTALGPEPPDAAADASGAAADLAGAVPAPAIDPWAPGPGRLGGNRRCLPPFWARARPDDVFLFHLGRFDFQARGHFVLNSRCNYGQFVIFGCAVFS